MAVVLLHDLQLELFQWLLLLFFEQHLLTIRHLFIEIQINLNFIFSRILLPDSSQSFSLFFSISSLFSEQISCARRNNCVRRASSSSI